MDETHGTTLRSSLSLFLTALESHFGEGFAGIYTYHVYSICSVVSYFFMSVRTVVGNNGNVCVFVTPRWEALQLASALVSAALSFEAWPCWFNSCDAPPFPLHSFQITSTTSRKTLSAAKDTHLDTHTHRLAYKHMGIVVWVVQHVNILNNKASRHRLFLSLQGVEGVLHVFVFAHWPCTHTPGVREMRKHLTVLQADFVFFVWHGYHPCCNTSVIACVSFLKLLVLTALVP